MRVFVINLPGETTRRASASSQLDAAGIKFEIFTAIHGDEFVQRCPFDACDEHEFLLNTGRYVTGAEKGCFASHRSLWKHALTIGEPIVVLEDDFELLDNFAAALSTAGRIIDRLGYIRLQSDLRARKKSLAYCDDFLVSRYTKAPHGTLCYAISPRQAGYFLSLTRTMEAPVDVFIKKFWEHGQPLFALQPYPVISSPLSKTSTIGRPPKQRKSLPVATRRFLRKVKWEIYRSAFNLRQYRMPADITNGAMEVVFDTRPDASVLAHRDRNRD